MTLLPEVPILPQPDDVTCGPTSLHAVYRFWGDEVSLQEVIGGVSRLENEGTLAVLLGNHALARGYRATIHTYNLELFDPTWFRPGVDLAEKLRAQARVKQDRRLQRATDGYLEFLRRDGVIRYEELSVELLRGLLVEGVPVLTGLSATYLYGSAREIEDGAGRLRYDDVAGEPAGHFVVLSGWEPDARRVGVSDPLHEKPRYAGHHYTADVERVLGAILLGALTYDANLLVVRP